MIINMAYVEIEKYKFDKQMQYSKMIKEFSQFNILSHNEVIYKHLNFCKI